MIVVDEEGTAWSWGNNEYGQLGQVRNLLSNLNVYDNSSKIIFEE